MTAERKPDIVEKPSWGLFEESLTPETPPQIAELLHLYYEARIKVLCGDRDGAKEIYQQINADLLEELEQNESGDINIIGKVLTGEDIFDAPNKPEYFDKSKIKAILPRQQNGS